jgi:hypothetical protein
MLMVSLLISAGLRLYFGNWSLGPMPGWGSVAVVNIVVSLASPRRCSPIYKLMPSVRIVWRDVLKVAATAVWFEAMLLIACTLQSGVTEILRHGAGSPVVPLAYLLRRSFAGGRSSPRCLPRIKPTAARCPARKTPQT